MDQGKLKRELIVSGDGSHTIKVEQLKEHYHSHKGAIAEGLHVFIESGLNQFPNTSSVRILEVGFGTGLNSLLTALNQGDRIVHYVGLEAYPVAMDMLKALNYALELKRAEAEDLFKVIHELPWGEPGTVSSLMSLEKIECKLEDYNSGQEFDLVYYDAFAPHAQPELWTPKIFSKLFDHLKSSGLLVTYCAKGQVRRDLEGVGFTVERLPGPPGKREMIRAKKDGCKTKD